MYKFYTDFLVALKIVCTLIKPKPQFDKSKKKLVFYVMK